MKVGVYVFMFILLFLILLILIVNLTHAQVLEDIEDKKDDLIKKGENIKNIPNTFSNTNTTTEYLKKEWRGIFEKNRVGKVLLKISDFLEKFNPIYKAVLGVEYSLSWAFVFAVIIWFTLFIFLVNPAEAIFNSKLFGIIAAVIIASLVGLSGVIKIMVDILSKGVYIPFIKTDTAWIFWFSLFITIIITIIMNKLGILTKKAINKQKEQSEQEELKRARELIKIQGKVSEEILKPSKKK